MASHDDLIQQFVAITDTTPSKADTYLKVSDYDLEQAIQLFFETGGAMDAPEPAAAETSRPAPATTSAQVIEDDDVEQALRASAGAGAGSYEDDEAMARRLQEEFYGSGGAQGEENGVRAPIPRTMETLVGGYDDEEYGYPEPPRRRTQTTGQWIKPE